VNPLSVLGRQPLRRQVVAVTILIVVPLVAVTLWAAARVLAERQADLRDEAASLASSGQASLNQYLRTLDATADVLTRHPAVQSFDVAAANRLFDSILVDQPTIVRVTISDEAGAVRVAHPPVVAGRTPTMVLTYPINDDDGRVVGSLGFGLNLMALGRVFANVTLPPGSVITLTDRDSRVLARTLDPEKYVGTLVEQPGGAKDPSVVPRTVVQTGMDGVSRVFGNAVITRGPWLLSVGIPMRVAYDRAVPLWRRTTIITVVFALLSFAFTFLIAAAVSRPLARLTAVARRIASGDLSPPPPVPTVSLEIAQLHKAFETMAGNLRDARDTLDRRIEEERRMREALQSLQRQVVRQERLAAVGVLVSGVAHELNNPLQAILGSAELLERSSEVGPRALEDIEFIKTQSDRARDIIRNLSRFGSQQTGPATLIDLRDVVREVEQLRRQALTHAGISLEVELSPSRAVHANFTEIEQVLLNFVINAQHALETGSRIGGRMKIRLLDAGKRVRVEVLDDGPGVSAEDEPKLFQPFFTTKPVGMGTGLGLSVSYGIIDSYGGAIGYARNEWHGATFFFELPAADARHPSDDRTPLLHGSILPGI